MSNIGRMQLFKCSFHKCLSRVSFLAFFLFFVTKYKLLIQADYYTNSPDVTFLVRKHKTTSLFQIFVVTLLILSELWTDLWLLFYYIFFVIFSTMRIKTHLPWEYVCIPSQSCSLSPHPFSCPKVCFLYRHMGERSVINNNKKWKGSIFQFSFICVMVWKMVLIGTFFFFLTLFWCV